MELKVELGRGSVSATGYRQMCWRVDRLVGVKPCLDGWLVG